MNSHFALLLILRVGFTPRERFSVLRWSNTKERMNAAWKHQANAPAFAWRMNHQLVTVTHLWKDQQKEGFKTKTRPNFMRFPYTGSGETEAGFWLRIFQLLDQQHWTVTKITKAKQEGFLRIDLSTQSGHRSLSFAAQNLITLLLLLCSEYTTRQPAAVWRVPRASHTVLVLSRGNRWSAAGYNLLFFSLTPLRKTNLKKTLKGDTPSVPWSLTQGTT